MSHFHPSHAENIDVEAHVGMIANVPPPGRANNYTARLNAFHVSESPTDLEDQDFVGVSLPTADQVRTEMADRKAAQQEDASPSTSRHRRVGVIIALSLLFAVGVVALSVGISTGRANVEGNASEIPTTTIPIRPEDGSSGAPDSNDDGTDLATLAPVIFPPLDPVPRRVTLDQVVAFLIKYNVSDEDRLTDSSSHQYSAASWLASTDVANIAIPSNFTATNAGGMYLRPSNPAVYEYITRYVLVLTLYSFDMTFLLNHISGLSICRNFLCNTNQQLISLAFPSGSLNGTIPSELGALSTLETLDLSRNAIHGSLPTELCRLTNLQLVEAQYNQLNGTIPECLLDGAVMTQLNTLVVSNNFLSGDLPHSGEAMPAMVSLAVDDNLLTIHNISTYFDRMPNLRNLMLEDNLFRGNINDSFLRKVTQLEQLDLSNNMFTGTIPPHLLTELPSLRIADLHGNRFTGKFPVIDDINNVLELLAVHQNNISGTLSPSISSLQQLKHLDISSNEIGGILPEEFANLTQLQYLFVADNPLRMGPIPTFLAKLTALQELGMKTTNRNSSIPEFIGNLTRLSFLDLDHNELTGFIPKAIGQLSHLQFLLLNRNQLSGQMPSELANLERLRVLLLEGNPALTGDLTLVCGLSYFSETSDETDLPSLLSADCTHGGDASSTTAPVVCACCDYCCFPSDDPRRGCHNHSLVASMDGIWEQEFARASYELGNMTFYGTPTWIPDP